MTNKIARILYYILFFVTPFAMAPVTSELFEFNKMIMIYAIAATVGALWVLQMIRARAIIFTRTPLDIPTLLFFGALVASTLTSIDPHTSIFGYYGRFNGGLLSIIAYLTLYYGFVSMPFGDKRALVTKLLKVSLITSAFVILWGLPARLLGRDLTCLIFSGQFSIDCWSDQFRPQERMFSTLGQPNWLGAYLAIHFFIGLYFYLKDVFSKRKYLLLTTGYLLLNFSAILFTRSRSTYLAMAIGVIVVASVLLTRFKKEVKHAKKMLIAAGILILLCILVWKTGAPSIDKLFTLQSPKKAAVPAAPSAPAGEGGTESFAIRRIVWKGAVDLGLKYPLFGTGVETFAYSYYFTRPLSHNLTSEWDFLYNKAHNENLNYFATTGFVGIAAYFILVGATLLLFLSLLKQKKEDILLPTCLLASYGAILVTNFFGFSTTTINIFFFLLPAFVLVQKKSSTDEVVSTMPSRNTKLLMGSVILVYLYALLLLVNYVRADIYYATAKNYARVLEYPKAYEYFKRALELRSEHVYQDAASYNAANLAFLSSYSKDKDLTKRLIELSEAFNAAAIKQSPKNVLYYKTTAKNDYLFYQLDADKKFLDDGIKALDVAIALSPTDPKLPYTRAIFYSLLEESAQKQSDKNSYQELSLRDLDVAIVLKPDFRDAYFLKGQLLKNYGRIEEAKSMFKYILKSIDPLDAEVIKELQDK